MKKLILVVLLALAPLSWGEPLMTTPFKCITDYKGGVAHGKNAQRTGIYKPNGEEFRLLPRLSLPESVVSFWDTLGINQPDIQVLKSGNLEKNTYWFRYAENNPSEKFSWHGCNLSTATDLYEQKRIVCGADSNFPFDLFRLNIETLKLVYVYLGSWDDRPLKEGYFGDDSVFSFGTCRPYYD